MKCKIFIGRWFRVQAAFNNWAKGRKLTREVIIHEMLIKEADEMGNAKIAIIVYHPEGKEWDRTEPE